MSRHRIIRRRWMPARLCSMFDLTDIAELQHDGDVRSLSFSPLRHACWWRCGGHARPDDTQNSWERDEGRDLAGVARQDSIQPDVRCLAWSPSSHFLASGCEDMQVSVWISQLRKWSLDCQSGQAGIPCLISCSTCLASRAL